MPWARASSLDRLAVCAGSAWQRRERDEDKDFGTELAADWGRGMHNWKATGKFTGPYAEQLKARISLCDVDPFELWPGGLHEVARAFNSVTRMSAQRTAGTEEERDAWKLAFDYEWSTGTSDFEGDYLGCLWIDDLKTGSTNPLYPPTMPDKSAQLRWYALAACRARMYHGDVALSITHWPRPAQPESLRPRSRKGPVRYGPIIMPAAKIDDFERTLTRIRNEILARGPLRPNRDNCKFCPSRQWCDSVYKE